MVRIREPMIIAFHGMITRTRRSLVRASSAVGDVSLASVRAKRRRASGNARSPTLRSTVRIIDRPSEMTSHSTVPGSRDEGAPCPAVSRADGWRISL
jgi:hypothetical protein